MHVLAVDVRLQTSTPSDQLYSTPASTATPHFLNQAPPGAQQLSLLECLNVPHFAHATVLVIADILNALVTDVLNDVFAINSRSGPAWLGLFTRAVIILNGAGDGGSARRGLERRVLNSAEARSGEHIILDINP